MELIKIIVSSALFASALLFAVISIVIYNLNKKLISLGTYSNILGDMEKIAMEHDNYVNFMKRKGLTVDSIDKDIFMSVYLSGKFDGLKLALTKNKNEVEKILEKN